MPSTSPWNTPIFVIKKKSGKWRLLQDLRTVNDCMEIMGTTQPGLPQPVGIPAGYHLLVIDLKDCFFTIPLHPKDSDKFAFSVPSINFKEPYKRYQWVTLPQGMANSSVICQMFVARVIAPIRHKYSQLYISHYLDDILLAGQDPEIVLEAFADLQECLAHAGLVIASEKVQQQFPYQYLGHQLLQTGVKPQKVTLRLDKLQTLNDFQKLET